MTKTFIKGALVAAIALGATPAVAAPTPFTATANIVKPLEITKVDNLNFGTITMGSTLTTNTVSVAASAGATAQCDGVMLTCSDISQPAKFTVAGVGTQNVPLSYGTPPTLLTNADGDTVVFSLSGNGQVALTDGVGTFYAGGTITVASTTKPGLYQADFEVSANYQ